MASDTNDASAGAQTAGNADAAQKEAKDYWGYLIKPDKCGTQLFDRLLKGIAEVISKTFEPTDSPDLTPSQIAAFYRAVGGNYDVLFVETPASSLSFIYRSLGAFHSLQPAPNDDGYSSPTVPALKKQGFVTWQTIQLLLGPEEHVSFLQNAVKQFDVVDPETGTMFPKVLPADSLPDKPDDAMEAWYETVAQRLKREAEEDGGENEKVPHVRVNVDEHGPRTSTEYSGDSADEKHAAASYFSDPLYRRSRHTRPPIIRHFSKQPAHPYEDPNRGRLISSVRHMLNPFGKSRRMPGRYEEDSLSDDDRTPVAPAPPPAPRYVSHSSHNSQSSHKRPHPPRRESTMSSTDSDSDSDAPSRRRSPILRHRRSHEPATSPREYFPSPYEDRRYSHADAPGPSPQRKEDGPPPLYGPTKSPLFATHVAQMQAHTYYDRRPSMPARSSHRPHNVRYTSVPPPPEPIDPPYSRERNAHHSRDRERDRERDGYERYRRRSEEFLREKERDREGLRASDRTRSHDRVKDDWDEREDRSRERDRQGM
ncbi:uncharacterized protein N0V89_007462 [Didymosphaeria variabile]|uniref:DUF7514 domain-containing protein n=1 Tax=Didymosphaeria variabile TaxID=1932322 RepID=A0A9W8XKX4_9PLEO|nr:uncharacterized protein N0V89_007462 [Didymosphaeria variabile]KAJ4352116.1 hypothetical protein N0V89_007462 [Didymosphaeria variabile]